MRSLFSKICAGAVTLGIMLFFMVLRGIPVYYLWNWLIPSIFGVGRITLMQSIGLSVLAGFLCGNLGSSRDN